ncbi:MAG: UDP-N-acetylmuramoyl-L-alanine--D-glutamate ligase [Firmicutes bacterium]|nr:UDP-N-acetylmuramoyl-L-alanine--D-glutamate ligase [Bacillota bacterium]MDY5531993.1 UDP-N-acetylmuramoyl-L-alanine--D-glutamate ligase [Pumilibacteraceae bacterium]
MTQLLKGKILVAGKGISGRGAAFALGKIGAYYKAVEGDYEKEISCGDYSLVVVSPGIPVSDPLFAAAEKRGIRVISEIELGGLLNKGKILAVTGTNGKTTVAKMAALMLGEKYRVALCGNIGKSFSEVAVLGGYEIAIVEVSSFQLETTELIKPDVAVITNIAEDHLDRHGSMEKYAALKLKIAQNMTENDTLVLSQDSISVKYLADFRPRAKTVFTCVRGRINGAYKDGESFFVNGERLIGATELPFSEIHNDENFLAAAAAASALGATSTDITTGIKKFTPENHRLSLVRETRGVRFYDDSKGTNVSATVSALREMRGSVCLIAGGSDKNCDFSPLFSSRVKFDKLILIGQTRYKIRDAAYFGGFSDVVLCDDLPSAVKIAYKSGCKNVLFSPACASFDMFENYSERGEKFVECVNALA